MLRNVPGWQGWQLCPYGKAKDWRLISPGGLVLTAREAEALPYILADLDYYQKKVRELEQLHDKTALHLNVAQLRMILEIADIVRRSTAHPCALARHPVAPGQPEEGKGSVRLVR